MTLSLPRRTIPELGGAVWELLGSFVNCPIAQKRLRYLEKVEKGLDVPSDEIAGELATKSSPEMPVGIVVDDTNTFRCVTRLIQPGDMVVEIGCSYGRCTEFIQKFNQHPERVLGIDVSSDCIEKASKAVPRATFLKCNALREWNDMVFAIRKMQARIDEENVPVVVMCDIGGNRELESVVALLPFLLVSIQPKLLLVKSEKVYRAGTQLGGLNDEQWFGLREMAKLALVERKAQDEADQVKFRPQQEPLRLNPDANPICRYHNYDADKGCLRYNDPNNTCQYDHEFCHACGEQGHRAMDCVHPFRERSLVEALLFPSEAGVPDTASTAVPFPPKALVVHTAHFEKIDEFLASSGGK